MDLTDFVKDGTKSKDIPADKVFKAALLFYMINDFQIYKFETTKLCLMNSFNSEETII